MTETKTPTRADYMGGKVTHREFYRAVAETAGIIVTDAKLIDRVKRALADGDEHLNTIPLGEWDMMAVSAQSWGGLHSAFKAHGDGYSLAGGVCLFKTMARVAAEQADQPQPVAPD